jgi:hypothetical protein
MGWTWELIAKYIEEEMAGLVDWDERFFICPDCGEPIYELDWVGWWPWKRCPICDFDFFEEE